MKLRLWLLYASLLAAIASCNAPHPNEANLISEMDSISYAVGMDIAQHYYQNQNVELNPDLLYQGFRDQALST
ncbi:MAG: FKBP-type peptidyl-prolyl cis-trans isomerase N-terminal domain-containing protein, partial [Bacteroidota bacterium]